MTQKEKLKKQIFLALCLGAACSATTGYAADSHIGYQSSGKPEVNRDISVKLDMSEWDPSNPAAYGIYANNNPVTLTGIEGQNYLISAHMLCGINNGWAASYGIYNQDRNPGDIILTGNEKISATAVGIDVKGSDRESVNTSANAFGIQNDSPANLKVTINGNTQIEATATQGNIASDGGAIAMANAYGISGRNVTTTICGNTEIKAKAQGGKVSLTANGQEADVSAAAAGIAEFGSSTTIKGNAVIEAIAAGGSINLANSSPEGVEKHAVATATGISVNPPHVYGPPFLQYYPNASLEPVSKPVPVSTNTSIVITGNTDITAKATGGNITSENEGYAAAGATGIDATLRQPSNATIMIGGNADIKATAVGGNISGNNYGDASAVASGISTNSYNREIYDAKGSKTFSSKESIDQTFNSTVNINGNAGITVTAAGGSGSQATAQAVGIDATAYSPTKTTINISGNADILAAATGGTGSRVTAHAAGIIAGSYPYYESSEAKVDIAGNARIKAIANGGNEVIPVLVYRADSKIGIDEMRTPGAFGVVSTGPNSSVIIKGNADIAAIATGSIAKSQESYNHDEVVAVGIASTGAHAVTEIKGDATVLAKAKSDGMAVANGIVAIGQQDPAFLNSGQFDKAPAAVTIGGNAFITAQATGQTAYAYALYAANHGTISINQLDGNTKTVQIIGDVAATQDATINLSLNNSNSFLCGNLLTGDGGAIDLTLAKGAELRPDFNNQNGSFNVDPEQGLTANHRHSVFDGHYSPTENTIAAITLKDNGTIDYTWDNAKRTAFRTLNIGILKGDWGLLKINTDVLNSLGGSGDRAEITTSKAPNLQVAINHDPVVDRNNHYSGAQTQHTFAVSGYSPVSIKEGKTTLVGKLTEKGAYSLLPGFDGTAMTTLTVGVSTNAQAAASMAGGQLTLAQNNGTHLKKRLGELRDTPDSETGAWARVYAGNVTNEKYSKTEFDYQGIQAGYDIRRQIKNGRQYFGGALSYTKADNDFYRGSGDSKYSDIALYQSWIGNSGHYYDIIAKHGRMSSNYHVTDLSGNYSDADYQTWRDSLSAEYGYKKQLKNNWYLEPQAELTFGRINAADYTTSAGMKVQQDSIDSLIGRLGIGAGKKLAKGSFYTSLSMLHEFKGVQSIKADTLTYEQDMGGTWYEFILGGSAKLGKNSTGYLNVEKLFGGDVSSNWQLNAGCRVNF